MSNPIVLITGGSRGIGAATARLLARRGYDICISYRQRAMTAEALLDELRAFDVKAIAVRADIASEADVEALFATVDSHFGKLDALVNNAGMLLPQTRAENMTAERIDRLLRTNVTGTLLCCREAIRRMSRRHGGSGGAIVNVSSMAARTGSPDEYIDYAASKGAVDSMTVGLAKELAQEGIRVNGVRPGPIHTDMHADGGEPDRIERVKAKIPLGRGGEPEEVAAAIGWLLSDESSFVTGSFIDVAGGG
ncbi:SDR family oxidoreductase [Microbulbifer marinus]|uniref:NAD(P)-dependent dehydrogenase, short-chain alcohol dehydrogenase family n=1 Tax=Microbulbifer marinus TaxID=658218 RepID=A0A1H3ZDI7_9GAMM|nr:SDR family oxidoreductase [Microbulbifer marinus]SEA21588.1 NAD(P)-dependent dehydrogenase, short-chain alcohol dehydrogenase family [Microbulbifer marinus]